MRSGRFLLSVGMISTDEKNKPGGRSILEILRMKRKNEEEIESRRERRRLENSNLLAGSRRKAIKTLSSSKTTNKSAGTKK